MITELYPSSICLTTVLSLNVPSLRALCTSIEKSNLVLLCSLPCLAFLPSFTFLGPSVNWKVPSKDIILNPLLSLFLKTWDIPRSYSYFSWPSSLLLVSPMALSSTDASLRFKIISCTISGCSFKIFLAIVCFSATERACKSRFSMDFSKSCILFATLIPTDLFEFLSNSSFLILFSFNSCKTVLKSAFNPSDNPYSDPSILLLFCK